MALSQGLWVAALGMTMVFVTLGVLLVAIVLLDRAFRPRPVASAPDQSSGVTTMDASGEDRALAAAVGLAVALAASKHRPNNVARPFAPSAWRVQGRRQQMSSSSRRW
ncbi:MAG: hypothetical protein HYY01_08910 [Chloroflexi bacterium]|nr:hypothetical protein [Chloroflexota bacterium]